MDKVKIIKGIASGLTGLGSSQIVHAIIDNNVERPDKLWRKITLGFGTYAISGLVGVAAKKYTGDQIDEFVESVNKKHVTITKSDDDIVMTITKDDDTVVINDTPTTVKD